jgi:hypothetical protein
VYPIARTLPLSRRGCRDLTIFERDGTLCGFADPDAVT